MIKALIDRRAIGHNGFKPIVFYDKWLILSIVGLIVLGIMMVSSSSVMVSTKHYHQPFYFLIRQICYLSAGFVISVIILRVDSKFWESISIPLLLACLILLILVLIPGIGKVVNGSRRWVSLGFIGIQVSELAKFSMILYIAGYLVRQKETISSDIMGFIKPMIVLAIVCFLLLKEPDFGAAVVVSSTVMAMLFLGGVKLRYYFVLLILLSVSMAFLALSSPYRVARLTAFLNPWADQFNTGYQLTQSFIAFGRGGLFGLGLGESVQKLFYLPEAHTDFIFAVLAEELGFAGVMLVVTLYSVLIFRGFLIGYRAHNAQRLFASYVAYGISFWIGLQAFVNMCVNVGLLPTKGLTLPFLSYGGASIIVNCIAIALLLRIDYENRWNALGL